MEIPKNGNMDPPIRPDESDCCNSGCNPCILDVYEEQLRKFKTSSQVVPRDKKNCISQTSFTIFKLINVEKHSKDCNLYTFEFVGPQKPVDESPNQSDVSIFYEPGQHFMLKAVIYDETHQKAYTPLFIDNQPKNQFTVLVKLYENGKMSRFFQRLKLGSQTLWRGPYGNYRINYEEKNVFFIAQGTGIAPFYTIIRDVLNNEECYTFLRLFFCCHSENVLLQDHLYDLMQFWNFKYELFVSGDRKDFQEKYNEVVHFTRLGIENIELFLKGAKGSVQVLVCGAASFCDNVKNMLIQCGVQNDDITVF